MPKRSGFTLIELLITISIIAILSAIGLVSYTTFVKNARDAKRQSDVKFIQSALEQYHADQKYYPIEGQFRVGYPLKDPSGNKTYLAQIPAESQISQPQYRYEARPANCDNSATSANKCINYCLFVKIVGTLPFSAVDTRCPVSGEYNYSVSKP